MPDQPHAVERWLRCCTLAGLLLVAADGYAQTVSLPRNHHPWGRFNPGAWSQVRKVTEEYDENGKVKSVSITETTTTLTEVTESSCTLNMDVCVEVAGKRFTPQPKTVKLGYNGETNGQTAVVKRGAAAEIDAGDKRVPCVVLEITLASGDKKLLSTVHYANTVPPFVLKRETRALDPAGKPLPAQTTVDVLATDMPYAVLNEIKSTALVRTISREAKGATYTWEVFSVDVPGGVVSHTSKEVDERGRVLRRSYLELQDHGTVEPRRTAPSGVFHRGRWRSSGSTR